MYYAFNKQGDCLIYADSPIEPIDGYTIIESDKKYNLWEIKLVNGTIQTVEPNDTTTKMEQMESTEVEPKQLAIMNALAELAEIVMANQTDKPSDE